MLSEEALILYAFFIGLGLLALGIWETLGAFAVPDTAAATGPCPRG